MGRMYSATFELVAATAAQDLFEINAPADASVVVHGVWLSQSSDVGDAASEMLNIPDPSGQHVGQRRQYADAAPLSLGTLLSVVRSRRTTRRNRPRGQSCFRGTGILQRVPVDSDAGDAPDYQSKRPADYRDAEYAG